VKCEIWQSAPHRAQFRVCRGFNVARRGLLKADITSAELWSCEVQCRRSRRAHASFALSRPERALTYLMLIMRLNAAIRPIGMNLAPLASREVDIAKRSIERTSATTYGYPRTPGPLPNSHAKRFSDHASALHAVHSKCSTAYEACSSISLSDAAQQVTENSQFADLSFILKAAQHMAAPTDTPAMSDILLPLCTETNGSAKELQSRRKAT